MSAVQEYRGPLISVNNSNDETLGHTGLLFPNKFLSSSPLFPVCQLFSRLFHCYFPLISHSSIVFSIISQLFLISQVFTVRENLGLLTPLGADYVTRPFFPNISTDDIFWYTGKKIREFSLLVFLTLTRVIHRSFGVTLKRCLEGIRLFGVFPVTVIHR